MRKNKIRILHVAQAAGGVDHYIRMLLKYLDKDKFENILVCSQDFHKEDYNDLVDYFEQIEMTRAIGGSDLKAIKAVRKLIRKYNPDIVYAHSSKAGAIARVADIGLKNHCVYNPHGWAFNMRCSARKKAMYTAIERVAAPFCDKIICISDAEKRSALDRRICREDKLQVIFNGVDIEAYENGVHGAVTRKDLNIQEDAFVVGMVGRMSPQKAPDVFVKMAKKVKDAVPNAHFIIVGNGNQEDEIRKYAEDNSSCVQVWRRKRPCSAISIIPHSGRDLLWNISASYYAGSCIDRPDCIYSSLLLTASGVGMVLCDVSNQLSHFCKARALISIGRYLYGKQKI